MEESLLHHTQNIISTDTFKPLKDVFDHLVCGVVLIDVSTRRVTYANRVALKMTRWEEEEILGGLADYFSVVDYIVREVFVYHMSMEDTKFFPYLETKES